MPDSFDWRILDRHLAGDASPDDERALAVWLAADPRNADVVSAARAAGRGPDGRVEPRWNVDRAWSRVAARMHDARDTSVVSLHPRKSKGPWASRSRTRLVASAVGVGVLAAAALLVVVVWRTPARSAETVIASRTHEVLAAPAQQTRVTLGDGTHVVLNAGSRLRYSDEFGRGTRDVELDGEGYFDVVHDEARPFRVHARGSIAEDVGTRFVVRAYSDQTALEVIVTHGSVVLRPDRPFAAPMLLVAGQRGRVANDGAITLVNDDVERWLEWTRGGIVLEGLTLGEAAVELGRRFDVRIDVAGEDLARRTVSARFDDEPLPRVLDALGAALGARWTRVGDRIVIARSE